MIEYSQGATKGPALRHVITLGLSLLGRRRWMGRQCNADMSSMSSKGCSGQAVNRCYELEMAQVIVD